MQCLKQTTKPHARKQGRPNVPGDPVCERRLTDKPPDQGYGNHRSDRCSSRDNDGFTNFFGQLEDLCFNATA